jgi:hypothetical protein
MTTKHKYPQAIWCTKDNYTAYYTNGEGFIPYEEAEVICEDLAEIEVYVHDSGMLATHNMPCSVCKVKHAVLYSGMFEPCWSCQEEGWVTTKMIKFERKWYEFWK